MGRMKRRSFVRLGLRRIEVTIRKPDVLQNLGLLVSGLDLRYNSTNLTHDG